MTRETTIKTLKRLINQKGSCTIAPLLCKDCPLYKETIPSHFSKFQCTYESCEDIEYKASSYLRCLTYSDIDEIDSLLNY